MTLQPFDLELLPQNKGLEDEIRGISATRLVVPLPAPTMRLLAAAADRAGSQSIADHASLLLATALRPSRQAPVFAAPVRAVVEPVEPLPFPPASSPQRRAKARCFAIVDRPDGIQRVVYGGMFGQARVTVERIARDRLLQHYLNKLGEQLGGATARLDLDALVVLTQGEAFRRFRPLMEVFFRRAAEGSKAS